MKENTAVVTGMGVVSAIGSNLDEFWNSIVEGKMGIAEVERLDTITYITRYGGEVKEFPEQHSQFNIIGKYERCSQLALAASMEAIENSRLNFSEIDPYQIGLVMGTSLGGILVGHDFHRQWVLNGLKNANTKLLYNYPIHTPADVVNGYLKIRGPKIVVSNACAAGSVAIGLALDLILLGRAKIVIAGGADPLAPLSFAGFSSLQALSKEPCSPFSRSQGLTLGEGAGFLIIEELEHALQRNATILSEVRGYGLAMDAYHLTASDPAGIGASKAMMSALRDAGIDADDVDYINAHGTGTPTNDQAERRAIVRALGSRAYIVPISSTKSMIGHTLGAAGAIEGVACIKALEKDIFPPTVNFIGENDTKFDFVPNKSRRGKVDVVLSNSFAFGGNNVTIAFSKRQKNKQRRELSDSKVLITGLGVVNAAGLGKEDFWKALSEGRSCLAEIKSFNADHLPWHVAGEIPAIDYKKYMSPDMFRRTDFLTKNAIVSTKLAIIDSGIEINKETSERIGIIYGTGTGPLAIVEGFNRGILENPEGKGNPRLFPNTVFNAVAGSVSIQYKLKGPSLTIASGGVASSQAIICAADMIKRGVADCLIVLTSDEVNEPLIVGNGGLGFLSEDLLSRPFDRRRNGYHLGTGSCALILESEKNARKRGANVYVELKGYAQTSDGYRVDVVDPSGESWSQSMKRAMDESGLSPQDIDYYCSVACGSLPIDLAEAIAIQNAFTNQAKRVPVSSIKSTIGDTSGSTGAMNVFAAINAIINGIIPVTLNLEQVDERCNLNHIIGKPIKSKVENVLVSSMAIGGNYSSIVIGRYS